MNKPADNKNIQKFENGARVRFCGDSLPSPIFIVCPPPPNREPAADGWVWMVHYLPEPVSEARFNLAPTCALEIVPKTTTRKSR